LGRDVQERGGERIASELIERALYNGKYNLVHNPTARGRAPRYLVNGTAKPKGVTTILGQTLNKDLMQWAVDCMKEYLEAKLPLVTGEDLKEGTREYTRRRDSGGATGTEAHAIVEVFLKTGKHPNMESVSKEAANAYSAFVDWFDAFEPVIVNVEEVIYSEEFDYAGTYDAMMKINGKVYLTDLKTTNASRKAPNGVYAEHFIQLGAYAAAHEEQRAYEEANGGTNLVKVDGLAVISAKKNGKLDFVTNEDLSLSVEECGDMFKQVVNVSRFLTGVTKLLGGK
jgi:hypothetical protein